MFAVTVEGSFTAEHQLTMADGEKEDLHSHGWIVKVSVSAEKLDNTGIAVDFIELKQIIDDVTCPFEGKILEELNLFGSPGINASAENIARYIFDGIEPKLSGDVKLESVKVREAKGCWAKYSK